MRIHYNLIFMGLLALAAPAHATQSLPLITITGEGRVEAQPDMATISLGVTTTATSAKAALAENTAQLDAVLTNLKTAGLDPRDLQTSGLSLQPDWSNNGQTPKLNGYTASNMLTVRVRDLSRLGAILDAAVNDGANTLNGLQLGIADPAILLDEARKNAVADARHRAEVLAEAAGNQLGPIASIVEGGASNPLPQFANARATTSAIPVEIGEISLSASVTIAWQLLQ